MNSKSLLPLLFLLLSAPALAQEAETALGAARKDCAIGFRACMSLTQISADAARCSQEYTQCLNEAETPSRSSVQSERDCYSESYALTHDGEESTAHQLQMLVTQCHALGFDRAVEQARRAAAADLRREQQAASRTTARACRQIQTICNNSALTLGGALGPFSTGAGLSCLVARIMCDR